MKTPEQRKHDRQQRKNAAGHAAVGAGLVGTAAAANYLNDAALERKGLDKPVKSAVKRKGLKPAHARYAAAKVGIRGLQVTGIPLAAYGAYNMVKPDKKVPRVRPKDDIAKPLARGATFRDAADDYRNRIAKEALTAEEQKKLVRRKSLGRNLSLAAGTMGVGALALRSPEMARAVASRSKKLAASPRVQRLMAKEPAATKASNTLGIAAIGTGSVGSFNYASQQKLERKQIAKAAPKQFGPGQARRAFERRERLRAYLRDRRRASREMGLPKVVTPEALTDYLQASAARAKRYTEMLQPKPKDLSPRVEKALFRSAYIKGVGRVRVTGSPKKDYFDVVDSRDQRRLVHRSRVTPVKDKQLKAPVQPQLPFGKRDDKFLREYRDRISPKAEQGYNNMRRQRNKDRAWAVTQTGLTGLNAAGLAAAVKGRSKVWTPVAAGATAFSASQAVKHGRKAQGYDKGPMEGIRRKARDRANRGVYGADRGKDPVDKALRPMTPPIPRSVPKGMLRRPTQRRAHVSRRPTGRLVSVKSSFG